MRVNTRRFDAVMLPFSERFAIAGLAIAAALGLMVVNMPFLVVGVLGGGVLLYAIIMRPLLVVGIMLFLAPIDLAFLTGGQKGLLESLGGLDMNGIRLIGVTSGLAATALAMPSLRRILFGRYGIMYAAFLAWCALAVLRSPNPVDGARLLLKLSYPLLLFVTVIGMVRTREQLDRLFDYALAGAAFVVFFVSPLYAAFGITSGEESGHVRLSAGGGHSNPFSFYLLMMLYLSLARLLQRRQLRYLLLCAGIGVWMVLTLTRITFLAALVGFAAVAVYGAYRARSPRIVVGTALVCGMLAIAFVPIVLERTFGRVLSPAELLDLARHPLLLYESMNWQGREIVWPVLTAAFLNSPWIGYGMGSSRLLMREFFPQGAGEVVHNEYLRVAVETGIIGVILFALALFTWLGAVLASDRATGGRAREFTLPALAALLSWGVIAITDNPLDYYTSFTQFVALTSGAAVWLAMRARADRAVVTAHIRQEEAV